MRTVISVIVTAVGVILLWGHKILQAVGSVLDALEIGDFITDFQVWLINHPNLSAEIGPWILAALGLLSLSWIHILQPLYVRYSTPQLEIIYGPIDSQGRFSCVDIWEKDDQWIRGDVYRIGV